MKNRILIYDDKCPLCTWYSGLFVKYRFLNPEDRKAFSTIDDTTLSKIDFDKSRNEIPLLDISTNKVLYGIDSLLEILDQKIPFIKEIGNLSWIKWLLKKIYKLVSFNRKVIVARKCGPGSIDCSPDANYFYRFIFMAVCLVFNTVMLYPIQNNLFSPLFFYHLNIYELQVAHFVFVIINCTLACSFSKLKSYEFLGQVNMLALQVILLLILLMFVQLIVESELLATAGLVFTAAFIFKEYLRRMEYAGVLLNNKWIITMNLLSLTGFILYLFH